MSKTWKCDTCEKPIRMGGIDADARYTLADKPDERVGRHWACNVPIGKVFDNLRESLHKVERALDRVKPHLNRRD